MSAIDSSRRKAERSAQEVAHQRASKASSAGRHETNPLRDADRAMASDLHPGRDGHGRDRKVPIVAGLGLAPRQAH